MSNPSVTVTVKTVRKWMRELNIDLEITVADYDSTPVTKMICPTCKEFAPKMSSNVSSSFFRL